MILTDTYYVKNLLRVASEKIPLQAAKSKYMCPKVGN